MSFGGTEVVPTSSWSVTLVRPVAGSVECFDCSIVASSWLRSCFIISTEYDTHMLQSSGTSIGAALKKLCRHTSIVSPPTPPLRRFWRKLAGGQRSQTPYHVLSSSGPRIVPYLTAMLLRPSYSDLEMETAALVRSSGFLKGGSSDQGHMFSILDARRPQTHEIRPKLKEHEVSALSSLQQFKTRDGNELKRCVL